MSEPVLKSILKLMAISCTFDGVITDGEHRIIRDFVQESMPEDLARNYLVLFKEYADVALAGAVDPATICNRINLELNQRQKIVVLMHLLELAHVDGALDKKELDFVDLVSEAFKIDVHEYNLLKAFITDEDALTLGLSNILVISQERLSEKIKHIIRPQINAKLAILRIPSVEMYMLRTYGSVGGGLTLNGLRVREKHTYNFPVGSVIKSDLSNPIYYSDIVGYFFQDQHHAKICFEAKHVYYSFTGGKIGLRDLNLVEESGRLVGIMGSSGSGKSTLLNVLNGNELPIGGRVTVNGIDVHREIENKAIEGIMGYVPQDDLLIEELTVFQNMFYAAKLCFGKYSDNQLKELVHKTLQSLGLLEIAHLKVGNPLQKTISGGQRKRVNIGLELLREPAILFVDEPTSGLSSNDSENIMDLLKELSLKGKLVFVVIHQPSSDIFKMFDRLLILDVGGYQIYYGNPIEAVTYFKSIANMVDSDAAVCNTCGNVNPEQIFNIIETKVLDEYGRYTQERRTSPAQWRKHYEEIFPLERGKTTYPEAPPKTLQVPSRLKQWQIFTKRDVLSKLANTQYMFISLLQAPFLALVLSVIVCFYKEGEAYHFSENPNIPAYIFMSIIVAMFIGLIISAEEIIKDNKIRKREALLHLSWGSYLFSKVTILFTLSAIQTLSYVLIGNWILDIRGMHFAHWLVLFSTACFSNILGLNISSAFNSAITIYILIPVLLIPQLILGGIVVKFTDINPHMTSGNKVPLISEVMTSRWAFEALMVSQFKDNEYGKLFYQYDKEMAMADYKKIYYLPRLESAVDFCEKNYNNGDGLIQQQAKKHLAILANELEKEARLNSSLRFQHIDILKTNGARLSTEIAKKVREHLVRIQQFYVRVYNKANKAKDDVMRNMVRTNADRDKLVALSKAYQNKAVEELVKNTIETQRIVDYGEHVLQRIYPIYQTPTLHPDSWIPMLDFRTHFYAPTKPLLGYHIDTLWFNMGILWTMTLILYAMLYYRFLGESFRTIAIVFGSKKKKSRN